MVSTNGLMRTPRACGAAGFTLIELMAVLTVLAILSVVAVASYRKYAHRGKNMEAIHMLAEIGMKQALHFSLYGVYVDTTTDATKYSNDDFYPADITGGQRDWDVTCPDDAGSQPRQGLCELGIRPSGKVNYQYLTVGWAPNDSTAAISFAGEGAGTGPVIMDTSRQWWYAIARGDLDANGQYKYFVFTSEVNEVYTLGLTE